MSAIHQLNLSSPSFSFPPLPHKSSAPLRRKYKNALPKMQDTAMSSCISSLTEKYPC